MSSSSSSWSSSVSSAPAHHFLFPPSDSEQLLCVHCDICYTILAVIVPRPSLSETIKVRCGHCSNILSLNITNIPPPPLIPHLLSSRLKAAFRGYDCDWEPPSPKSS